MYEMRLWNTGCLMQGERVTGRAETFSNCSMVYRVVYHMGNLYIANSCGNLQIIVGNCTSSALVSEPVGCFLSHNHWLQGPSALRKNLQSPPSLLLIAIYLVLRTTHALFVPSSLSIADCLWHSIALGLSKGCQNGIRCLRYSSDVKTRIQVLMEH